MRRQKLYDGKEDMSYNQTCSKGEREEKPPQAAWKGCQQAARTSKPCQMLLLPRNGAAGPRWHREQMAVAGKNQRKGGRKGRGTQLPKRLALALLAGRDFTQLECIKRNFRC